MCFRLVATQENTEVTIFMQKIANNSKEFLHQCYRYQSIGICNAIKSRITLNNVIESRDD
ncbi:CLUMA_CG017862, isoform A [Clunio marinus]|uniref:CLUMA_CG017862, isoform A n=1 Tax=Clunio marinus TaxID=568069 RepID=A0A1J1J1S2_9DIPT|nr:CLUMA_CG017862, isoform A [Clunio marinus]